MEQKFRILICRLRSQEEEKVPRRRKNTGGHFRRAAGANLALCVGFIVVKRWFSFWGETANKRRWMFKWTNKQNESLDGDHVIIHPPESQEDVADGHQRLCCVFLDRGDVWRRSWVVGGRWFVEFPNIRTFCPGGRSYNWPSDQFTSTFLSSSSCFFVFFNLLIFHHLSDWSFLSALLTVSWHGSCTEDPAPLLIVKSLYWKEKREK